MVSYPSPGSSLPWRVALDSGWLSTCAGASGFCTQDPGRPVCVDVSAVGFIRCVGRLCSRGSAAVLPGQHGLWLQGTELPAAGRRAAQQASSSSTKDSCFSTPETLVPTPPPQVTSGQVLPQHLRQDGAGCLSGWTCLFILAALLSWDSRSHLLGLTCDPDALRPLLVWTVGLWGWLQPSWLSLRLAEGLRPPRSAAGLCS